MKSQHRSVKKKPTDRKPPTASIGRGSTTSRFTMSEASRSFMIRLSDVVFYSLLAYVGLMTIPLGYAAGAPGLDPSWVFGSNYFIHSHFKFGPDIVFTFGPLGFLFLPEMVGQNIPIALVIRGCIWLLLFGKIAAMYGGRRFDRLACILLLVSLLLAQSLLTVDYMAGVTGLLFLVSREPEQQSFTNTTLPLSLLAIVAFLTKTSIYAMLMMSLAAYYLFTYIEARQRPSYASILRLGCVALTPFIAYLVYNPSLKGLSAYIVGVSELGNGYSEAMSTLGLPQRDYLLIPLLIALMLGLIAYSVWRRWMPWGHAACIVSGFFVGLKHGIVRADGHLAIAYDFALILFAIVILNWNREHTARVTGVVGWTAVCIVSVIGMAPFFPISAADRWSPTSRIDRVRNLFQWNQSMAALAARSEANVRSDRLPDALLARIQRSPITIFPTELTYGQANHLNLFPLYTLQAYAAYTHRLDRLTADHVRASPADTRLLMEWNDIDGRHPLLDVPATWMAIYSGFQADLAESNFLLLKKRQSPKGIQFKPIEQEKADLRQWQAVPKRAHAVSVSVSLSPTLWGTSRRMFYKTNPLSIEFETDSGILGPFRVIPDVLREPVIINCLPFDVASIRSLLSEGSCQQRVTRFRFLGEGLESFSSVGSVAFSEAPDERLRFIGDINPRDDSTLDDPKLVVAAPIWSGSIDAINGVPPSITGENIPLKVALDQRLEIRGWAASNEKTGEAFESVYAILGRQRFRALVTPRPDVAKYLGNPRLGKAGFDLNIDASMVPRGTHAIQLVGVTRDKRVYRYPSEIYVFVR